MQTIVLGHQKLVNLFKLIGYQGQVMETESQLQKFANQIEAKSDDIACVLTTRKVADLNPRSIQKIQQQQIAVMYLDQTEDYLEKEVEKVLGIQLKNLN